MSLSIILLLSTLLIAGLRFTVPGRDLMGWEGWYEFLAHVYVTSMAWIGCLWWGEIVGNLAWFFLAATSALELKMFFVNKAQRNAHTRKRGL